MQHSQEYFPLYWATETQYTEGLPSPRAKINFTAQVQYLITLATVKWLVGVLPPLSSRGACFPQLCPCNITHLTLPAMKATLTVWLCDFSFWSCKKERFFECGGIGHRGYMSINIDGIQYCAQVLGRCGKKCSKVRIEVLIVNCYLLTK